ncbi:hypothetical protein CONPUDRAFT_102708 [Coniophora puteana RWD-64-598 SS2]|uniref:DUF2433 domain-containing protein n=1 Tax=Coniophora puteana (strain RWD-64-598) TaxID=741705 RepID=A0A5M3MTN6_CONPW|nr:uncharacterized protein CONPUDRAFT_102708 [Coniophora puteana RWD-64-598 SS2]EIW82035.1 hypothetical protein CONPUDRAFT_102708 [Coniophora puteana RWD-64-598 SS2]
MQSSSRPASSATRPGTSPNPQRPPHVVNTQTRILDAAHGRILCIADIRGRLSALNDLAREANAQAIIHTGDFGFFEGNSLDRINDRTLRHLAMYSPLIPTAQRTHLLADQSTAATIRSTVDVSLLSEFPLLLSGQIKLQVPVYTVWGACEDVFILEKFRSGSYNIENLHVLDEATTRCLDVGGVKLRLLGLGGALVPHKIFDNGDGNATIAGGQGTMWTTALQIGELVDTAQRVFDPTETRLLVTHSSPGREGIMAQLALVLKADLTISAGLHFRYASSYNEFSVQSDFDGFRHKLLSGKDGFDKVWESVKAQVDTVIDEHQRVLLDKALSVIERVPPTPAAGGATAAPPEEPAWKNCWNWNLCDAAYGNLVLDVKEGRVSAELKSQGFNYAYRRTATPAAPTTPNSGNQPLPPNATTSNQPTKASTPAPGERPGAPGRRDPRSVGQTPPPLMGGGETPAVPANNVPPKTNGTPTPSDKADKAKKNKKDRKDKETQDGWGTNDGWEEAVAKGATPEPPKSGKTTPAPAGTPAPDGAADHKGPTTDLLDTGLKSPATESGGARTPTSKRPHRNPWTLFIRLQQGANDAELREFFGEGAAGITRINYPQSHLGRQQRIVYVEFGDEEAMKQGLEKHAERYKETIPEVKQATDREDRMAERGGRGGGRGRGRGGFVARGFAAAGLTKGRPNGGTPPPGGENGAA